MIRQLAWLVWLAALAVGATAAADWGTRGAWYVGLSIGIVVAWAGLSQRPKRGEQPLCCIPWCSYPGRSRYLIVGLNGARWSFCSQAHRQEWVLHPELTGLSGTRRGGGRA